MTRYEIALGVKPPESGFGFTKVKVMEGLGLPAGTIYFENGNYYSSVMVQSEEPDQRGGSVTASCGPG